MSESDRYKRKADELLRQAAQTTDSAERGSLVEQAAHWHSLALEANRNAPRPPVAGRPQAGKGGAKDKR
jgi:hypothetical protein